MTTLLLAARDKIRDTTLVLRTGGVERCAAVIVALTLVLLHDTLRPMVLDALSDAYLGVGVFVAATFALFFWLEARFRIDTAKVLEDHRAWEIPLAAGIGALPGCGGAVMVITQFALGRASFGAVVAVLTATMGDAAFLMLAQRPQTGLLLIGLGFVAGTISGWVVNKIHGRDFLRVKRQVTFLPDSEPVPVPRWMWAAWGLLLVPGLFLGIAALFQVEWGEWTLAAWGFDVMLVIGVVGAIASLIIWALSPSQATTLAACRPEGGLVRRVALNTNFVTVWVVVGFLAYELGMHASGVEPGSLFAAIPALLPLIGILVGFVPGCGPQILVTTLYLKGFVPFSAQLGNSISNDGDALFPAIAVSPRVALVATLYTAVPAIVLGYGYYLLFELR